MFGRICVLLAALGLASGFNPLKLTLNAKVGDRLRLPCRVPPKTTDTMIQWHLGNKQLTVGMYIMYYQNRLELYKPAPGEMTLIIKSVVKSDEAVFTCKSHDQTFSLITVNVQWKPEIIQAESSSTQEVMVEGSTGELTCIASGQPQPNITWYRRAQDESRFQSIGVTGEKLTIRDITRYGSDVFMCNASNVQGYASWEMNVTVHFPPQVSIYEPDMEASIAESVIMTCVVQGSPLYDFYFPFQVSIYEPDMEASIGESVIMTCVVQGSPLYDFYFPPQVSIYEPDMEASIAESVIMTCVVQGSPLYDFYWKFNNKKINNNWKYLIVQDHNEGFPVYFLTLMIRPSTLGTYDFGKYMCHADGSGKEAHASIQLTQRKKTEKIDSPAGTLNYEV